MKRFFSNFKNIIFSPSKAIESIKEKNSIILPLILSAVFSALTIICFSTQYLAKTKEAIEKAATSNAANTQTAIDTINSNPGLILGSSTIVAALSIIIFALIVAALYYGISTLFGGNTETKYPKFLSVSAWITFISALAGFIIVSINVLATGQYDADLSFNILMPVITEKTPQTMKMLSAFLKSLGLITIWQAFIWAFTLAKYSNFKKRNAYIIVFVLQLVYVLFTAFSVYRTL